MPHTIPFTVAGVPRSWGGNAAGGGGGGGVVVGSSCRRGPREGTVTVSTESSLRDLKVDNCRISIFGFFLYCVHPHNHVWGG